MSRFCKKKQYGMVAAPHVSLCAKCGSVVATPDTYMGWCLRCVTLWRDTTSVVATKRRVSVFSSEEIQAEFTQQTTTNFVPLAPDRRFSEYAIKQRRRWWTRPAAKTMAYDEWWALAAAKRKLSLEQCREILRRYNTGLVSVRRLASDYGVSGGTIQRVLNGRYPAWRQALERTA